ncbi:hypothetical protein BBJ28_00025771 [Nothophytophthora sp. Chile5]|nr:hypothetical protein BBJ28_00025771 [Nothophytophthora sp. Chile5]
MAGNKNEEVAALEALRDSSAELVRYLDNINGKLLLMNQQNECASPLFIGAVVGILMCTLWYAEVEANVRSGWHKPVVALLWVHNVGCVSLANSFFLLAGFHTYLLCVGTGTYDFILANGADGLCTRLLKCNCLRRGKKSKPKRSHVRDGDVTEAKSAEKAAPRSRRGSPPPGAVVVLTPPSPHAAGGRGETHSNAASGEQRDERHASMNPTEMVGRGRGGFVSASKQHMELSIGVNESEGIFEEIDLGPNRQEAPTDTAEVATTDL